MEKILPNSWIKVEVRKLSQLMRGVTYKKIDASTLKFENGCLILRGGNVQDGKILENDDTVYVDSSLIKDVQFIQKGDVIIVASTGSKKLIGKAAISIKDYKNVSFGAFLSLLRPYQNFNQKYFGYYFLTDFYREFIRELSGGISINNIRREHLENLTFPFPPLKEQNRITNKLDQLFGHLDSLKARLDTIPELLKQFRQAVLTQTFTSHYSRVTLNEVTIKIQDGAHHSPKTQYREKGVNRFLYITSKNIRNNYMDLSNIVYVDRDFHNSIYPRCNPEFGDVLLTKDGANTGNVTINTIKEPFSLLSSVCLIKTDHELLLPEYLKYFIQSPTGFNELIGEMTGTAIKRIILRKIKNATIPLPPLKEQTAIVNKVNVLFAKADIIEAKYSILIEQIDNLPQTILAKAFRGELVEQDPKDEPAEVLLKRIEKAKESMSKNQRKSKR